MSPKGYEESEDKIIFVHDDDNDADKVYVVGNFMDWTSEDEEWEMEFNKDKNRWELFIDKKIISGLEVVFYEFTFIVDGEWLDADRESDNVIHCPGYGYRYVIKNL